MKTPLTPVSFLARALRYYPDKIAIVDESLRFTYRQFANRVNKLSNVLLELGMRQGTKVGVLLPNTHVMLECFFGIAQMGGVLVPLNTRLQGAELAYILAHSDAEILIVDGEWGDTVAQLLPNLPQIQHVIQFESGYGSNLHALNYESLLSTATATLPQIEVDEDWPLSINYTSGTTSKPKGVILTHRNSYVNAADLMFHLNIHYEDVYLHTLPLFHVNGWGVFWGVTAVGGTQVCLRKIVPSEVLELFVRERISLACGAPTVLNMLANAPNLDSIQMDTHPRVATAGSPPPAAIIDRVQKALHMDIIHIYGMTEAAPIISFCEWRPEFSSLPPEQQAKIKARQGVSLVFSGTTCVVREDGSEVNWNSREIGEIVAQGNVIMAGYYKDPEATAKAIRDGWYHTGDLAVVHPDGYIEIVDRLKDVIISGGENISSVELESVLYEHPAVQDCAVVAKPDERWGEVPVAYILRKPGISVTAEELNEFCRDRLAHFKVPKTYEFIDDLPRTATGKLQKFRLREQIWQNENKRVH
ncbi:long-chain-fatty-acid--CoA ligase [Alicyclobacillaceae bacterium I2511]|nr:long-chain-fatty-acid--CoA ligase [Alicyclobacillaceae bacterium I2511]